MQKQSLKTSNEPAPRDKRTGVAQITSPAVQRIGFVPRRN